MKTVQTKSSNFVLVSSDRHEMPISKPYLNYCDLDYRKEKEQDYAEYGLKEYYEETFGEGIFQGYDYGNDIGLSDPFAEEILKSDVLLRHEEG